MTFDRKNQALAVIFGIVAVSLVPGVSCQGLRRPAHQTSYAQVSPRLGDAAEARGELQRPGSPPAPAARAPAALIEVMDYIWFRESRRGLDKRCWTVGPAGEYGEFQIIPIFVRDVERISGFVIDRADNDSCRYGIEVWLNHYAPRVGAVTTDELYELYRRGPGGYRRREAER